MDKTPDPVPAGWLAVLDESEADIAAGRIVSADVVLSDLEAGLEALRQSQFIAESSRDPDSDDHAVMRETEADLANEHFWRDESASGFH